MPAPPDEIAPGMAGTHAPIPTSIAAAQKATSPEATREGIFLMLLAIVFFTAMDAAAKDLIQRYAPPQVIWARFFGQSVLVLAFLAPMGIRRHLATKHSWAHMVRSAFQLGATSFFFLSLAHIGLAEATAIADVSPVLITLGAALFLGERLGVRRIGAVIVALMGALIIIRPGLGVFTPAAFLPLMCALCYAGNALMTRHIGMREGPWTSLLHAALVGTVAIGLILPFYWQPIATGDLWKFGLIGLLGSLAQFAIIRAFSMAEASVIAPFTYAGIIFATFWGYVLFAEVPDGMTVLGAVVIIGSGLYLWREESRPTAAASGDGRDGRG
jgi:drug/metabolite transporter (DMT)-like permease